MNPPYHRQTSAPSSLACPILSFSFHCLYFPNFYLKVFLGSPFFFFFLFSFSLLVVLNLAFLVVTKAAAKVLQCTNRSVQEHRIDTFIMISFLYLFRFCVCLCLFLVWSALMFIDLL
ncbi:hypothetical protein BDV96DRAFT_585331 [Lophiotrema nucula]|uniref:Uncharacterized protein n=1 Tax=Lophiotrema nucula TaxID=690887 RepID=A0A6A5YRQ4_9PLEO|nr:hypothetical protein BDV96DRAFT_585331 [Lophiotrema nucula]